MMYFLELVIDGFIQKKNATALPTTQQLSYFPLLK